MAEGDESGVMSEANDADVEVEYDIELGELALRLVDCKGTKGIPAPLEDPDGQS